MSTSMKAEIFTPAASTSACDILRVTSIGRNGERRILVTEGNFMFEFPREDAPGLSPTDILVPGRSIFVNRVETGPDETKIAIGTNDTVSDPRTAFRADAFSLGKTRKKLTSNTPYPIVAIEWYAPKIVLILKDEDQYLHHTIENQIGEGRGIVDTMGTELMCALHDPNTFAFVIRTDRKEVYRSPRIERR